MQVQALFLKPFSGASSSSNVRARSSACTSSSASASTSPRAWTSVFQPLAILWQKSELIKIVKGVRLCRAYLCTVCVFNSSHYIHPE